MNRYGWNKKVCMVVVIVIATCLITIGFIVTVKSVFHRDVKKADKVKQKVEVEKKESAIVHDKSKGTVTGAQVVAKYKKVKGNSYRKLSMTAMAA